MTQPETDPQSPTMAEAFCRQHLTAWTEYGHDFAEWRDAGIFADPARMSQAGALSLLCPPEEDPTLIVTMFRDRSWIVQPEPAEPEQIELGTAGDEQRILDLIHQALERDLEAMEDARGIFEDQVKESSRQP